MKAITVSPMGFHKTIQRCGFILGCLALALLFIALSNAEEEIRLKDRVEITIFRRLVRALITVERVGLEGASDAEKEVYKDATLPLLEYLDDTVLAAGDDVVLYPKAIADVIADEVKAKKPVNELSAKLLTMYQKKAFEKLARRIAVVVHRSNNQKMNKRFLKRVWERSELRWKGGTPILPLDLPATNAFRRDFSKTVLRKTPEQMKEHYVKVKIKALAKPPQPLVQNSVEAVINMVKGSKKSIGYVPLVDAKREETVRIVLELEE